MKKIIPLLLFLFITFLAFAQKADSTLVLGRKVKVQVADSLLVAKKDTIVAVKDSLKKKNFFAAKADNFSKWSPPKKAALMSAILPGSGQIYNKKGLWWRLPLCYGAYGAAIYTHVTLRKSYFFYKDVYNFKVQYPSEILPTDIIKRAPSSTINYNNVTLDAIYRARNSSRDNYERSFLWLGAAHLYCIADAFVTAHLIAFDINEDLSFKVQPKYDWVSQKPMLGVAFKF